MTDLLLIIAVLVFIIGVIVFFIFRKQAKKVGSLKGTILYQDTEKNPGKTLYAKTLPVCGKPDYIIKSQDSLVVYEYKSGRTPQSPYLNHTMQLMTYCFIAEDVYGTRPKGGIIKYPEREFQMEYTKEAEEAVRELVSEIGEAKRNGIEFQCSHSEHNT